jgi:hypothetical protein
VPVMTWQIKMSLLSEFVLTRKKCVQGVQLTSKSSMLFYYALEWVLSQTLPVVAGKLTCKQTEC